MKFLYLLASILSFQATFTNAMANADDTAGAISLQSTVTTAADTDTADDAIRPGVYAAIQTYIHGLGL